MAPILTSRLGKTGMLDAGIFGSIIVD